MTLGEKVKLRRICLRMSQLELANKTGMSQAFISQIESGARTPTANTLAPLAKALKCTADYLVYSEKNNKKRAV